MFVRKKSNASGIVSVQIIDKSNGVYQVVKTIGSSADPEEVQSLYLQGKRWIETHLGRQDMFQQANQEQEEKQVVEYLLSNIEGVLINGAQLILEKVFSAIGFDQLGDDILKHLVTARLSQPHNIQSTATKKQYRHD